MAAPDQSWRPPGLPAPQFVKPGRALIAFFQFGPPGGRPLVICHGLAAGALQFAADATWFAERGFRVILPDLRGHGRSGMPVPPNTSAFTLEALAGDMLAMLDALNLGQVDWIGNSLGGIVALQMMASHPERLRSFASFGTVYAMSAPRLPARLTPLAYRLLGRPLVARWTARMTTRDPDARRLVRYILDGFDPVVLPALLHNLARYDLIEAAMGYDGPILLIRGGRDRAVNGVLGPTLRALRGRPNFTLVDVPEGGHCANLDATGAVRQAVLALLAQAGPTGSTSPSADTVSDAAL